MNEEKIVTIGAILCLIGLLLFMLIGVAGAWQTAKPVWYRWVMGGFALYIAYAFIWALLPKWARDGLNVAVAVLAVILGLIAAIAGGWL